MKTVYYALKCSIKVRLIKKRLSNFEHSKAAIGMRSELLMRVVYFGNLRCIN